MTNRCRSGGCDGQPVEEVYADLTAKRGGVGIDLTQAKRLPENLGTAFMGDTKGGLFDIPGDLARSWLRLPANPNGRPNADVLKPWVNGMDVTRRPRDMWIVDFGWDMRRRMPHSMMSRFGTPRKRFTRYANGIDANLTASTGGGTSSRGKACGERSTNYPAL